MQTKKLVPIKLEKTLLAGLFIFLCIQFFNNLKINHAQPQKTDDYGNQQKIQGNQIKDIAITRYPEALNEKQIDKLRKLLSVSSPKTYQNATQPVIEKTNKQLPISLPNIENSKRCIYNHQSYLPGDILKTEQGWLRCTPTLPFQTHHSDQIQPENPAWVAIQ